MNTRNAISNAWLADILEKFAKRVRNGEDIHGVFTNFARADTPEGRAHVTIDIDAPRLTELESIAADMDALADYVDRKPADLANGVAPNAVRSWAQKLRRMG